MEINTCRAVWHGFSVPKHRVGSAEEQLLSELTFEMNKPYLAPRDEVVLVSKVEFRL